MRRVILSIAAACAALIGVVGAGTAPVGAEGLVDLSSNTTASPTAVSPPGALVFYTATFRNEGAIAVDGAFTNTTSNGTLFRAFAAPGCTSVAAGTADPAITCTANLAPGEEMTLEVIVQSPLSAPSVVTNSSTARVNPGVVQLIDIAAANNDSTVATPVEASTAFGSAAFVQPGGTLAYKKHLMTVRQAELGVVAFMSDVPAPEALSCGSVACKAGLHVDFDQDPRFAGIVDVDVNFGVSDPCMGLGNPNCHTLYFRKTAAEAPAPIQACGTQAAGDPCLESTYKANNEFHHVVVMGTSDPDLLAPVKNLANGTG